MKLFDRLKGERDGWGSVREVLGALIEGSAALRERHGLRVGQSETPWYGPTVVLEGPYCNVQIYAESGRDRVFMLGLVAKDFVKPDYPGFQDWAYPLLWLIQDDPGHTDADLEELTKLSTMPRGREATVASVARLCELIDRFGGGFLDGGRAVERPLRRWVDRKGF